MLHNFTNSAICKDIYRKYHMKKYILDNMHMVHTSLTQYAIQLINYLQASLPDSAFVAYESEVNQQNLLITYIISLEYKR